MKIYLGADHRGYQLKQDLLGYLRHEGYDVVDRGDERLNPEDDFPQFAGRVASALLGDSDRNACGILLCGSGQGMCMAANRFKGIRAAIGYDRQAAISSRNDDDSNVLCIPVDEINSERAKDIINLWLKTPFAGAPRFVRRIKEMDEL